MDQEYPTRYVAFVDILAFKNLVEGIDRDPKRLLQIRDILKNFQAKVPTVDRLHEGSGIRTTSISDAIVLSASDSILGLSNVLMRLEVSARSLLDAGYFMRGAVVRGQLYHDSNLVFGHALAKAYSLESQVAKFPRVIITNDIIKTIKSLKPSSELEEYLVKCYEQSADGPHYLHILRDLKYLKEARNEEKERLKKVANGWRATIVERLDETTDSPHHYEKVSWFAQYFNETVYGIDDIAQIKAGGAALFLTL